MNIIEEINEEMARFMSFYNHKPDRLYLGMEQACRLDSFRSLFVTDPTVHQRETFMNMTVVRVMPKSHIGFGLETPSPAG